MDYRKFTVEKQNIRIDSLRVGPPGKTLVECNALNLSCRERYGLVGENGSGKTFLLSHLTAELAKDGRRGIVGTVYMVNQRLPSTTATAESFVMASSGELQMMQAKLEEMNSRLDTEPTETLTALISQIEELQEEIDANADPDGCKRAFHILTSLGFDKRYMTTPFHELSGGWRMRAAIARGLFLRPSILIMDEPGNHLDVDAQQNLADLLGDYPRCLIVTSHDPTFLAVFCTKYIHLSGKTLHILKNLNDITKDVVAKLSLKELPSDPCPGQPLMTVDDLEFSWPDSPRPTLKSLNFGIWWGESLAVVGPNGSGKSTLLKLLVGQLKPSAGDVHVNPHVRVGYLDQDLTLPEQDTPLSWLRSIVERRKRKAELPKGVTHETFTRKVLARSGLESSTHKTTIGNLSGGQKARLLLSSVLAYEPHILVLDEPNNNLDLEGMISLTSFLRSWPGSLVIVTHSLHVLSELKEDHRTVILS